MKVSEANAATTLDVKFRTPFSGVPAVSLTPGTSVPQSVGVGFTNITSAGFTIVMHRTDKTDTSVCWVAVYRSK